MQTTVRRVLLTTLAFTKKNAESDSESDLPLSVLRVN